MPNPSITPSEAIAALENWLKSLGGSVASAASAAVGAADSTLNSLTSDGSGAVQLQTQSYTADANGNIAVQIAAQGFFVQQAAEELTFILTTGQQLVAGAEQGWMNKNYTFQVRQITGASPNETVRISWGDSMPTAVYTGTLLENPTAHQDDLQTEGPWVAWPNPLKSPMAAARTATAQNALGVGEARGGKIRMHASVAVSISAAANPQGLILQIGPGVGPLSIGFPVIGRLRRLYIADPQGVLSAANDAFGLGPNTLYIQTATVTVAGSNNNAGFGAATDSQRPHSNLLGVSALYGFNDLSTLPLYTTLDSIVQTNVDIFAFSYLWEFGPNEGPIFAPDDSGLLASNGDAIPNALLVSFASSLPFQYTTGGVFFADMVVDLCVDDAAASPNGVAWSF